MRLPLFFKTSTKCSSKAEGMICPVALWRWRRSQLLHVLNCSAKPKHDVSPLPLSLCLVPPSCLSSRVFERFGIGSLVLSCSRIPRSTAAMARSFRCIAAAALAISFMGIRRVPAVLVGDNLTPNDGTDDVHVGSNDNARRRYNGGALPVRCSPALRAGGLIFAYQKGN